MRLALGLAAALLLISAPSLACPASEKAGMTASTDATLQSVYVAEQPKPAGATPDPSKTTPQPKQQDRGRSDG